MTRIRTMVSRARETHTGNRVIRVDDELWDAFGEATKDTGGRAEVLREYMRFHIRERGAKLPPRPPQK
jgi:hypothetical protein